jgi:hypothetical protein
MENLKFVNVLMADEAVVYTHLLIYCNEDASKKIFYGSMNFVFDFELFISGLCDLLRNTIALFTKPDEQGILDSTYTFCDI